jgi:hypothetical protein
MVDVVQHNLVGMGETPKVQTLKFTVGKPVAYTSSEPVYIEGTFFKAGETFVTGMPKGDTWDELDPVEKAAADAGKQIKDDLNLDSMTVPALQALAASKGINLGDVKSKDDIITVIKAADEPTL